MKKFKYHLLLINVGGYTLELDIPYTLNDALQVINKLQDEINLLKNSRTETFETGTFERRFLRIGKKKSQQTSRNKPEYKNVTLFFERGLSYYDYPAVSNNFGFINIVPNVPIITSYDFKKLFNLSNIVRWYSQGGKLNSINGKSKSRLAQDIRLVYNFNHDKLMGGK